MKKISFQASVSCERRLLANNLPGLSDAQLDALENEAFSQSIPAPDELRDFYINESTSFPNQEE